MSKYFIDIGYADSFKILSLLGRVNKIRKEELIESLINKEKKNFFAIKNIRVH